MTITFKFLEDALDCATALGNAGRVYVYTRNAKGEHEITTRD